MDKKKPWLVASNTCHWLGRLKTLRICMDLCKSTRRLWLFAGSIGLPIKNPGKIAGQTFLNHKYSNKEHGHLERQTLGRHWPKHRPHLLCGSCVFKVRVTAFLSSSEACSSWKIRNDRFTEDICNPLRECEQGCAHCVRANIERLLGKAWLGNYGCLEQD